MLWVSPAAAVVARSARPGDRGVAVGVWLGGGGVSRSASASRLLSALPKAQDGALMVSELSAEGVQPQHAVVRFVTAVVHEHQAAIIRSELQSLAQRTAGRVGVDFSAVNSPSSACLNMLIEVDRLCTQLGGRLVLFGLGEEMSNVLRVTKMDRLLHRVGDEAEARRILQHTGDWASAGGRSLMRALVSGARLLGRRGNAA